MTERKLFWEAVRMFPVDTPNYNGIIYPKEVVEKAIAEYNAKESRVGPVRDNCEPINLEEIGLLVDKYYIKDGFAVADIEILPNTPKGRLTLELLEVCEATSDKLNHASLATIEGNKITSLEIVGPVAALCNKPPDVAA